MTKSAGIRAFRGPSLAFSAAARARRPVGRTRHGALGARRIASRRSSDSRSLPLIRKVFHRSGARAGWRHGTRAGRRVLVTFTCAQRGGIHHRYYAIRRLSERVGAR